MLRLQKMVSGRVQHKETEKIFFGLVAAGAHPELIKAVRALMDFAYLASLPSHTTTTLLALRRRPLTTSTPTRIYSSNSVDARSTLISPDSIHWSITSRPFAFSGVPMNLTLANLRSASTSTKPKILIGQQPKRLPRTDDALASTAGVCCSVQRLR
ncbi:hypothetical protein K438DRAFT_2168850 [Mycena galopus ATCC 62051]|nr:hypothetical protein K438DRAFT_2168850 [Mycena galopus ATCC 62051]